LFEHRRRGEGEKGKTGGGPLADLKKKEPISVIKRKEKRGPHKWLEKKSVQLKRERRDVGGREWEDQIVVSLPSPR